MNKKHRFSAAAMLLVLPFAAQAAIEIYGAADVSLDYIDNGDPSPADEDHTFSLTSEQSRIGLRGREPLGDGMAALWQFENGVSFDNGGWGPGRDTFVGLETGFGNFLLGKHATPYRMSTDDLDVFADTRADYNAVIGSIDGQSLFNNRADNALLYMTPQDKRLRFALAYSTRVAGDDDLPLTSAESRQHAVSTSLVFASGPLYIGLSYEVLGDLMGPRLDDGKATKLGLGWDFGQGTKVSFIWEDAATGEEVNGDEVARAAYYFNVAQIHGNMTYKFAYGRLGELDSAADSGADYAALGGNYALSAHTDLYLLYTTVMNDSAGNYGLQPDHDGTAAVAAAGDDVSALSVGLIHRFGIEF